MELDINGGSVAVRRLLFAGLTLAVLAFAAPASGGTGLYPVIVEPSKGDNTFSPAVAQLEIRPFSDATAIEWRWGPDGNGTSAPHNVYSSNGLFRSSGPATNDSLTRVFSAGTFRYFCDFHGGMTGKVRAEPSHFVADGARNFRITWALPASQTGNLYDVRFRAKGGSWRMWRKNTSRRSAMFGKRSRPVKVVCGRTYQFQARSKRASNRSKRSRWSPVHSVRACAIP